MRNKKNKDNDPYSLRDIYDEMELDLITSLKRNLAKHTSEEQLQGFSWEMWQKTKLRNLREYRKETTSAIYRFRKRIKETIETVLNKHFSNGERKATIDIPRDGKNTGLIGKMPPKETQFFGTNKKKLDALVKSTTKDFSDVEQAIYRKMDDTYRQTIFKAVYQMASGTVSLSQAIDKATNDFLQQGINCITYKNGRRVNIADYAEMALRTASHRATLLGEGSKRDELGVHLIFVSAHANCCKLCVKWQGQILIDDVFSHPSEEYIAEYKSKYKLLSEAIKDGLLHPNCRHSLATYFEGVTRLPTMQDPRIALINYNNEQKQRALEREIRKRKRIVAGVVSIEDEKEAKANLRIAQKNLRQFLVNHSEFKQDQRKEKIYGKSKQTPMLDAKEKEAVIKYTSPDAYKLNDKLRNGLELSNADKNWISNLDSALDKMPVYQGRVSRSLSFMYKEDVKPFIKTHKVGESIKYNQYLSTTCGEVYNKDAQVQLIIQSKSGKDIRYYNQAEQEVLFKVNTNFIVCDVIYTKTGAVITLEEE